jgi:Protein of unknown function (DUF4054)
MSAVVFSAFFDLYPEFNNQPPSLVQAYLDDAEVECPESIWGARQQTAVSLLTAHRLAARVANVARMIGAADGGLYGNDIESTIYGQEFARIRAQLPISGFVI